MNVTTPTPRHSLHQLLPKVVKSYGDLHSWVWQVVIAVAQQHHLIVMRKIVVWYRDSCWPHHCIDQTVLAMRKGTVIYPYVFGSKDRDSITVWFCAVTIMCWAWTHISVTWVGRNWNNVKIWASLNYVPIFMKILGFEIHWTPQDSWRRTVHSMDTIRLNIMPLTLSLGLGCGSPGVVYLRWSNKKFRDGVIILVHIYIRCIVTW